MDGAVDAKRPTRSVISFTSARITKSQPLKSMGLAGAGGAMPPANKPAPHRVEGSVAAQRTLARASHEAPASTSPLLPGGRTSQRSQHQDQATRDGRLPEAAHLRGAAVEEVGVDLDFPRCKTPFHRIRADSTRRWPSRCVSVRAKPPPHSRFLVPARQQVGADPLTVIPAAALRA